MIAAASAVWFHKSGVGVGVVVAAYCKEFLGNDSNTDW